MTSGNPFKLAPPSFSYLTMYISIPSYIIRCSRPQCLSLGPVWNQPFSKELWLLFLSSPLSYCGTCGRAASTRRRDFHIGCGTVTSLPGYSLLSLATKLYGCFCPKHEGEALRPIFEALCLYSILFSSYSAWEAFIQHSF